MCSYNAINGSTPARGRSELNAAGLDERLLWCCVGKPACANDDMLNGILRDKWGWDGFVVSDYDAWKEIMETHHYAASYEDAGAVGLNAGLDQEGGFGTVRRVAC